MFKINTPIFFVCFIQISFFSNAQLQHDRNLESSRDIKADYTGLKSKIKEQLLAISLEYEKYENSQILYDIEFCITNLHELESQKEKTKKNDSLSSIVLNKFNHIVYTHKVISGMKEAESSWARKYFEIWERTFFLKKRVDNLFIKKEIKDNIALNISDESQSYRKKHIYKAYNNKYIDTLQKVKNLNSCDYLGKSKLLEQLISLLHKSEKLLFAKNTKQLEKSLKNESSIENAYNLLMEY